MDKTGQSVAFSNQLPIVGLTCLLIDSRSLAVKAFFAFLRLFIGSFNKLISLMKVLLGRLLFFLTWMVCLM